ncbi:MAG: trigger factor [Candidatus Promineifilaceae bacterium]
MSISIHTNEDDQRQLELKVDVSEERVEQAMRARARQLANEVRIPGFRRGKVPYNVILQRFGRDMIRAEAVEELVQPVYEEAITEAGVSPYGRASLDDMEIEPLSVTFTIPLEPVVTLSEYRSKRKEIEEINITDEAVEEALEQVQFNHQEVEVVDRPAESGDVITVGGKGELLPETSQESNEAADEMSDDDSGADEAPVVPEVLFDEESIDLLVDEERVFPGTDFVENLIGKSAGDEISFKLAFPEDYEEEGLAGRTAEFNLNVLDVKKRDVPALDDELAKLEGDYETLDELRDDLRQRLQDQAEAQAKEELIEGMVDELLEGAEIVYPPAAVEMEIDETLENFKNQVSRSGWDFEDYMKLQSLTEDSLRDDFRESSEDRLRRRLVMRQFVLDEKLRIEAQDVEALIDERVARFEDNEELRNSMRNFYLSGSGFDMISSEVLSEKVHDRIKAIFSGTAPDLADLEEAEAIDNALEEEE